MHEKQNRNKTRQDQCSASKKSRLWKLKPTNCQDLPIRQQPPSPKIGSASCSSDFHYIQRRASWHRENKPSDQSAHSQAPGHCGVRQVHGRSWSLRPDGELLNIPRQDTEMVETCHLPHDQPCNAECVHNSEGACREQGHASTTVSDEARQSHDSVCGSCKCASI